MAAADELRPELESQIDRAHRQGRPHVEINAGKLHRKVDPITVGKTMPTCCSVMMQEYRRGNAEIIFQPPSGQGPWLTIRYYLPRPR